MKDSIVTIILLINFSFCMAQQIDYYPPQKESVSDSNYKYGTTILKETYAQIKKNNGEYHYVIYWNLAVAYMTLKNDDIDFVKNALKKSRELHLINFSDIFTDSSKGKNNWEGYLTEEEFNLLYSQSLEVLKKKEPSQKEVVKTDKEKVSKRNSLTQIIAELGERDNRYRKTGKRDLAKQKKLDIENMNIIDSLYAKYNTYIGKSIVGEQYAHVMWAVIQHSDIVTMENYLPVIYESVISKELNEGMLKLLIDRIYALKCNYQIYGSQAGVQMASNEIIESVKVKYAIKEGSDKKVGNNDPSKAISKKDNFYYPKGNTSATNRGKVAARLPGVKSK